MRRRRARKPQAPAPAASQQKDDKTAVVSRNSPQVADVDAVNVAPRFCELKSASVEDHNSNADGPRDEHDADLLALLVRLSVEEADKHVRGYVKDRIGMTANPGAVMLKVMNANLNKFPDALVRVVRDELRSQMLGLGLSMMDAKYRLCLDAHELLQKAEQKLNIRKEIAVIVPAIPEVVHVDDTVTAEDTAAQEAINEVPLLPPNNNSGAQPPKTKKTRRGKKKKNKKSTMNNTVAAAHVEDESDDISHSVEYPDVVEEYEYVEAIAIPEDILPPGYQPTVPVEVEEESPPVDQSNDPGVIEEDETDKVTEPETMINYKDAIFFDRATGRAYFPGTRHVYHRWIPFRGQYGIHYLPQLALAYYDINGALFGIFYGDIGYG